MMRGVQRTYHNISKSFYVLSVMILFVYNTIISGNGIMFLSLPIDMNDPVLVKFFMFAW